jgi:hypothetical protein
MGGIEFKFTPSMERFQRLLSQPRPGEHVWTTMVCYRVTVESLRGGETMHLDPENIATAQTGCFICEQPYSERLSFRKCTGEPKG